MTAALVLFIITYILMLTLQKQRPWIALCSAAVYVVLGAAGVFDLSPAGALSAVDYNVLLMIGGMMGTVALFIESGMPMLLAEHLLRKVSTIRGAVLVLSVFSGVISAFIDNVATVLMLAPVGLAVSRKLKISPVPVLISIAVSSNLQGAATLVGDTTSMLLASAADMNFMDFFFMRGKPGIFWGVELGAFVSALILLYLFRKNREPVDAAVETEVSDLFPSFLLAGTVLVLILMSLLPEPEEPGFLRLLYGHRSGLTCVVFCLAGLIRDTKRGRRDESVRLVIEGIDRDTILLLFGLFIVVEGIRAAGVIDGIALLFYKAGGDSPFLLYTLIVFASVLVSAFVDNIPYVATMLPVVRSLAQLMGDCVDPYVFYFGLLIGATLGGNLTPIGASANITAIGILKKNGENVGTADFLRIGVPFTLAAVISGWLYIWIVWHP